NETSIISGTLIPNQDFITSYRRKNITFRALAIGGTVAAVSAVFAGAAAYAAWLGGYYLALKDDNRKDLGKAFGPPDQILFTEDNALRDITWADKTIIPGSILAIPLNLLLLPIFLAPLVLLVGIGLSSFWFIGDDPGRYNQY